MKRKKILALLVSAVMAVGVIGCGSGGSKKEAEQKAAAQALQRIRGKKWS